VSFEGRIEEVKTVPVISFLAASGSILGVMTFGGGIVKVKTRVHTPAA
jgi:hypothetical protein